MDLRGLIARMSLDQKVGQIITYEFIGFRLRPDTYHKLEHLHCGGLRITPHINEAIPYEKRFDQDLASRQRLAYHCHPDHYAEQIASLQRLAKARPLGLPLHIAIDQEGDFSCDFARGGVNLLPSAMGMSATGDPELVCEAYRAVGRQLRAIGATMVHSPVLDVNSNPYNPEICTRSFGDTAGRVVKYAGACLRGFMAAGIVPTAKHFPGRGASAVDLHHSFDEDRRTMKEYATGELLPYRRLIAAGLPAVMMSHQICPAFGDGRPATVSPACYRYLREKLGFAGVITTDAMGMKGVLALHEGLGHACAEAAAAGADLVLAKCHPAVEQEVFDWIKRYVNEGRIAEADLDEKIYRILAMKAGQGLFKDYFNPARAEATLRAQEIGAIVERAARASAFLLRDRSKLLPLKPEQRVLVVEPYYREWQSKGFDNWYHPCMLSLAMERYSRRVELVATGIEPSAAEEQMVLERARESDVVVVNTFYWRGCPTNRHLIGRLLKQGASVVQVSTAPYEEVAVVKEAGTVLVTWGQVPACQRNGAAILYGKARAQGTWPLKSTPARRGKPCAC